MVNSNTDISADPSTDISGDDGMQPLVIEDTTSQDQLDLEADVVLGSEVKPTTEEASVDTGIPSDDGGGIEVEKATTLDTEPSADESRINDLITKRMAGIQSAADKRVAEAEKSKRLAEEQAQKHTLEAEIEASLQLQERQLAEEIGEDGAKRYVRDKANTDAVREQLAQRAEIQQLRNQTAQQGFEQRGVLMTQWFDAMKSELSLEDSDMAVLHRMVTRETLSSDEAFMAAGDTIGAVAERLGKPKTSASNQVPSSTPDTNPGTGRSTTNTPTSDSSLTASAREKPAWSWSEAEHAAMRRSSFGG
jgi:hypothetical protein